MIEDSFHELCIRQPCGVNHSAVWTEGAYNSVIGNMFISARGTLQATDNVVHTLCLGTYPMSTLA
ncbi:hypothetical protein ACKS0A_10067 [Histoplasma ohiense]